MKKWLAFAMIAIVLVIATACGSQSNSSGDKSSSNAEAKSKDDSSSVSGQIIVGGSTALQPLAEAAKEGFNQKYPDAQVQIQGGGSGTGLSNVTNGSFNIGMSDIFAESASDIPADQLVDHKVAVVAMTAAVNKDAGVTNLSQDDLIKVFTGKVTNWKEVGGNDVKITLVNRPDGSGTRATFDEFALKGATPAKGIEQDASDTVKKIISTTKGAVGYLALSYFDDSDDSVVAMSLDGVKPTVENVQTGKFPVWAYEHMYTKGEPKGVAKAFIDYMLSDDVQGSLVEKQGYLPVTKMMVERDASGKQTDK
ncbi:phosphate-binding protein PstS [Pullulanibacillus camelliae]|uniref:Phosphate-binding protein n=1 Tax=Pullulanibacillus camelliae TaxID=1707096 RepID=A0A8J2YCK3_9BACL|nr:phosphate ABC transporter substrate-binding protein [Pullulanibacillus camelliae]GGE37193.1 phosphate-binding protein PstS [Pullulanibacillus camelliae]